MAKRGLVILLPMRVRAQYPNVEDEVINLPELTLPPFDSGNGGTTPTPTPVPTPTPSPTPGNFTVTDISSLLPRAPQNDDYRGQHLKHSITFHWEGPDAVPMMDDGQTVEWLKGIAQGHINKDWGNGQGGGGIMYHEVIAQSGNVFITRNDLDILWHAGNDAANLESHAILVVCSAQTPMTQKQIEGVIKRHQDFATVAGGVIPAYPHSAWSATQCPGDNLRSLIASWSGGYRG